MVIGCTITRGHLLPLRTVVDKYLQWTIRANSIRHISHYILVSIYIKWYIINKILCPLITTPYHTVFHIDMIYSLPPMSDTQSGLLGCREVCRFGWLYLKTYDSFSL